MEGCILGNGGGRLTNLELRDRVALVTGGSRGIGLAVAKSLAEAGCQVAVVARDGDLAQTSANGLEGDGHLGLSCDVADAAAVKAAVSRTERDLGPISILVNNAGITRDGLLARMKNDDFDLVISVNLRGTFNVIRACTRGMMRRRSGAIVNVSSVIGLTGNPGQANYAASKAGIIGLTKSIAKELAPRGIRCNAVAPGFIRTDMTADLDEEQVEVLRKRVALGRLGDPNDVAGAVRFLAGPQSGYITGQVLVVDGGMVI